MKTILKKISATLFLAAVMTMGMMAQAQNNRPANMCTNIPDLTEEQAAQLKDLRMEQMSSSQNYRNQMGEIMARQRTLMADATANQKELNKLVDEKTALMNKHLKEGIAHKAKVSEILTKEQQLYMNQMQNHRQQLAKRGAGHGQGKGFAPARGKGPQGAGRGPGRGPGSCVYNR